MEQPIMQAPKVPSEMRASVLLVMIICLLSCSGKNEKTQVYETEQIESPTAVLKQNDEKLPPPESGEWLASHKERGQTFKEYTFSHPPAISESQNTIYLQPIGTFDSLQTNMINYTRDYLEIFFGVKTTILKTISDKGIPDTARRIGGADQEQLLAPYIMSEILKKNMPEDAICMMAITEKDIYPEFSWNFVFGLSSFKDKIGVTSLFRFSDQQVTRPDDQLFLERLIKVSSHEIGHLFGLKHCINAICSMNGTNSLGETDIKPNRLCSECAGKICWNLKLDPLQRTKKLVDFFVKHKMEYDLGKISPDLNVLDKVSETPTVLKPQGSFSRNDRK
ncbi:MAG: archaemetzincin [Bacteroidia bacterium]